MYIVTVLPTKTNVLKLKKIGKHLKSLIVYEKNRKYCFTKDTDGVFLVYRNCVIFRQDIKKAF